MRVLVLLSRFPLPARRGDQLRALHHLRCLAARHTITCCALTLTPPTVAERRELEQLGVCTAVIQLGWWGALPSLARVATGDPRPLQTLLFLRRRARAGVAALVADGGFDLVHAQLVRTVPYLRGVAVPTVVDLVDALSDNFARRATLEHGVWRALSVWEGERLARYEARIVQRHSPCLVVGESDRAVLGEAVRVVPNGVDLVEFPFRETGRDPRRIVFAGNLGYFPNVDASRWLVEEILPRLRMQLPDARLHLVGARPTRAVRRLAARPGVSLAADVPAMAPELAAASVAIIPLRAGSGLQNKVLEAMAVGTPVVATSRAVAALAVTPGEHLLVADDAPGLAAAVASLLADRERARTVARAARALVERQYRWEDSAALVERAWEDALRG